MIIFNLFAFEATDLKYQYEKITKSTIISSRWTTSLDKTEVLDLISF